MFKNILLAVDGSDNNKNAAMEAVDIAKSMGAKLTAVYVIIGGNAKAHLFTNAQSNESVFAEESEYAKKAFEFVEGKAKEAGIEVKTVILLGTNAGNALVDVSLDYDLIVCGSLGLTGVKKALIGSVSSTLVRNAECPVLICRD